MLTFASGMLVPSGRASKFKFYSSPKIYFHFLLLNVQLKYQCDVYVLLTQFPSLCLCFIFTHFPFLTVMSQFGLFGLHFQLSEILSWGGGVYCSPLKGQSYEIVAQ
jgi:hypothetical protein